MTTNSRTVVHLLDRLHASGMERMLVSAAPYFMKQGVQMVIVGHGRGHTFVSQLQEAGFSVKLIPSISSPAGMVAWGRLLRSLRPGIVHLHSERNYLAPATVARIAARSSGVIRTIHSIPPRVGWHAVIKAVRNRLGDHLVDMLVACSPAVRELEAARGRTCELVWNWVDDQFTSGPLASPDSNAIMLLGNCAMTKNHEAVLRAVADSNYCVFHVGSEKNASFEEARLLDSLEGAGVIRHRGPADPYDLLRLAKVLALPSRSEGMSVAAAEAACLGVRLVVSTAPGLQWAGDYGAIVADDNWLGALNSAVSSPPPGLNSALAARERFAAARGVEEYARLYDQIVRSAPRRRSSS